MNRLRIFMISAIVVAVIQYPGAQAPSPQRAAATAPEATAGDWPTSWRPTIMGMNGMVTAGHPLAAEAGMRILQQGGLDIRPSRSVGAVKAIVINENGVLMGGVSPTRESYVMEW